MKTRIKRFMTRIALAIAVLSSSQGSLAGTVTLPESEALQLRDELCNILQVAHGTEGFDGAAEIQRRLISYGQIDEKTSGLSKRIAAFWNANASLMICPADNGLYPRQHLFKRAIELNIQKMILKEYFFSNEVNFPIDPNVTSIVGKLNRHTLLDYIDEVISRPNSRERYNIGQIVGLRRILIRLYNAKGVKDLPRRDFLKRDELARRSYELTN